MKHKIRYLHLVQRWIYFLIVNIALGDSNDMCIAELGFLWGEACMPKSALYQQLPSVDRLDSAHNTLALIIVGV